MAITAQQRENRKSHIGGSDVPTIFGCNPFASAHDLWLEKTGQVPGFEGNDATLIGTHLEPAIKGLYETTRKIKLFKPTSTFADEATGGLMRVNPDFFEDKAQRGSKLVESKSNMQARDDDAWGEPGTDEVPLPVMYQVQAQMACTDSELARVARLFGGYRMGFSVYEVRRNNSLIEMIREEVQAFWELVESNTPPSSLPSEQSMKRRQRVSGKEAAIDPELVLAFDAARKAKKLAEDHEDAARLALLAALGDADQGLVQGWNLTYREQARAGLDTKSLTAAHPELAKQFATSSTYRVLRVSPIKEKK
jgi:putative phage-type endonuclease